MFHNLVKEKDKNDMPCDSLYLYYEERRKGKLLDWTIPTKTLHYLCPLSLSLALLLLLLLWYWAYFWVENQMPLIREWVMLFLYSPQFVAKKNLISSSASTSSLPYLISPPSPRCAWEADEALKSQLSSSKLACSLFCCCRRPWSGKPWMCSVQKAKKKKTAIYFFFLLNIFIFFLISLHVFVLFPFLVDTHFSFLFEFLSGFFIAARHGFSFGTLF